VAWQYATLLVLSPAILYGLALSATALISTVYRRQCPACGRRDLKYVGFIRASVAIDGRPAPDHWTYHRCESCRAAFKLHHGQWHQIEAGELAFYTADRAEPAVPPERRPSDS
jgi:hypothetical protein